MYSNLTKAELYFKVRIWVSAKFRLEQNVLHIEQENRGQLAAHVGAVAGVGGGSFPLLLPRSVVSLVTSERTGSAVCVIFLSHADGSSFSFLCCFLS